jgi:glycerol-3-phosphate O-acyltransferase / dihydroxyacetone phosphate acyltransferase
MVRLTAKDTLFGQPNFSSWLIEASGALPMKRQKDHGDTKVDNSQVMEILKKVCGSFSLVV